MRQPADGLRATDRVAHVAELAAVGAEAVAERALVDAHRAVGLVAVDGQGLEGLAGAGLGLAAGGDDGGF